ncbi:MAG TPA: response regulator [Gammaproteobacteria bacterium]
MKNRPILLVEDNPDDEALALRAFKNSGIMNDIVVVRDGVEALDYLFVSGKHADRYPAANPAVVLLDLKLPKLDGLDVLKEIRRNPKTRRLPVVILTSSKEDRDLIESYERGANSYVRKPVDFNEFAEAVTKLGVYWLLLNQTSD